MNSIVFKVKFCRSVIFIFLLLLASCVSQMEFSNGRCMLRDVHIQERFGQRYSGSKELYRTAKWLESEIKKCGLVPEIDSWEERGCRYYNVCTTVKGDKEGRLIVGSHYDIKKFSENLYGFTGANDAASSTAVVLQMIRYFSMNRTSIPTIEFYFFDGEECVEEYSEHDGLHGSKRVAKRILDEGRVDQYLGMILLDMVGDKDLNFTLSLDTPRFLYRYLKEVAEEQGIGHKVSIDYDYLIHDDHVPFQEIGINAINLIDFEYGPNNRYWHSKYDNSSKVSAKSLEQSFELAVGLIFKLAE